MMTEDRNNPLGFAQRTQKNLEFIKHAYEYHKGDVHVVAQLMNSLLGIVIVPNAWKFKHHSSSVSLEKLVQHDWPMWNITYDKPTGDKPKTKTLECLIWHLRNAAAHGRFKFLDDPNSRELKEVLIQVEDAPGEKAQINWRATITGYELYRFCLLLSDEMEERN